MGWPHYNRITWPHLLTAEVVRYRFLMHRIQDLLGVASLLCTNGRLFAGTIFSRCAGHEADAWCVRQAFEKIIPLEAAQDVAAKPPQVKELALTP
jgi:hypothetical protein